MADGGSGDRDDFITSFEPRFFRGRARTYRFDQRSRRVGIGVGRDDSQQALLDVVASAQTFQTPRDGTGIDGESDPRVIPARLFLGASLFGHCRDDDAKHVAANIDQRTAVEGGGDPGIGLQRLAPQPVAGADDAHRDRGGLRIGHPADRDRVLPHRRGLVQVPYDRLQRLVLVHFQQDQFATLILGHDFGGRPKTIRKDDQDRRCRTGGNQRGGEDVSGRINDGSHGGGIGGDFATAPLFGDPDQLDTDNGARDLGDRIANGTRFGLSEGPFGGVR